MGSDTLFSGCDCDRCYVGDTGWSRKKELLKNFRDVTCVLILGFLPEMPLIFLVRCFFLALVLQHLEHYIFVIR